MVTQAPYTVQISAENARYIREMLAAGLYASEDEVVAAGIGALRGAYADDETCPELTPEQIAEVKETLAEIDAGRMKMIPAAEVFAELRAYHASRQNGSA